MKTQFGAAALLALGLAGGAHAEGCTLDGGVMIPEIEALNQLILDKKFSEFAGEINSYIGVDVAAGMDQIGTIFSAGFDGCATIAQRRDIGGMTQSVIEFYGTVGPLFGYWLSAERNGEFELISFNMNTELDTVLADLR
jgi:hypothetical protein